MSEPEDKPSPPKTTSAASHPGSASPSALDSDWDALLGSSSSGSDRPIFAPPGSKPPRADSAPEPTPRTSQAGASVSGEFVVAERPEPAMPSRSRPIERAESTDQPTARLQIVPRMVTLDDEDMDSPSEPAGDAAELEQPRARAPIEPSAAPQQRNGTRNLVLLIGGIAAVASIVVITNKSRDDGDRDRAASRSADEPSGTSDLGTNAEPDFASETTTGTSDTGTDTGGESEPSEQPKPKHVDPRDPSLVPAGTPEENAKAFLKLPVSIHDGPPLGGIGRSGIHIDEISTARGRDNTDCREPTQRFSISDEYVNVCFRIVHPREQEWLRLFWEKDGKVTRRGRVRVPELHAYTTRAYLLLRPEYVGSWRVRIAPDGEEDIDLAVAEFSITE